MARYAGLRARQIILTALTLSLAPAQVRVWQATLTLPTYEEGAPDTNPPFDAFSTVRFNYPYTLRENLTNQPVPHDWRAVYLENEYLKCSVLPDIGGHLYTCIDKINGQSMFYANPSIKKANIGYRGAWAAFGIEFNFPVSHNWVSMSPVRFSFAANADGSASVWVGNIDRVYGMEWNVELRLQPGSTVLEEHVTLNNRSDVRHRFYWWNNAGVEVKDDSRICYPMRFTASHGFTEVDTWPVDSTGKDLSVIRNQTDGPVSRFVHGSREPFMGVWRPDTNSGTVHYAEYAALPAKKTWSWGVDEDGLDWRRALSDNNSAYVEVQAGLFRNQETYAFLEPRQTIRFSEYWMPARGIGGISRANLAGVLNLTRRAGALLAAFNANNKISTASIRILQGARILAEETANLTPEHTWSREILHASPDKCNFELRGAAGNLLLRHTEGEYDWTPVSEIKTGPQPRPAAGDALERGTDQELQGELLVALGSYQEGLRHSPDSFELTVAAGRLCAGLQRYDEAIRYLEAAAARATWNPEIAYYLGLAYDGAGDYRKARTAYETAARMPSWRAAASLKLGELLAREGDRGAALPGDACRAKRSCAPPRSLSRAGTRAQGRASSAVKQPSAFREWETGAHDDPALLRFLAADPERVLEIAAEYLRLGLYRAALDLLTHDFPPVPPDEGEPGAVPPQRHPLVAYYRGYCRTRAAGESAAEDYAAARRLSTLYIFPSRAEDLEVLRAAIQADPDDPLTARYLLGTQYFARGLVDNALAGMERGAHHAKSPILRVARRHWASPVARKARFGRRFASLPRRSGSRSIEPQTVRRRGNRAEPHGASRPRSSSSAGALSGPARICLPNLFMPSRWPTPKALEFDSALALFRGRFFPREEGGTNVRQVWVDVHLLQAMSQAAAGQCTGAIDSVEALGTAFAGLPFTKDGLEPFVNSPRTQYLIGQVDARCGHAPRAVERWRRVSTATRIADLIWAWAAAKKLEGYNNAEWTRRLEAASTQAQSGVALQRRYAGGCARQADRSPRTFRTDAAASRPHDVASP